MTRAGETVAIDAQQLAERLFDDHMPANMLLVGAAFQHGCLPLGAPAIERAIELNGAAVDINTAAFRWGRAVIAHPERVAELLAPARPEAAPVDPRADAIVAATGAAGELKRLLELRVADLIAYQDAAYAERYATRVSDVAAIAEARAGDQGSAIAEAYARGLYKLMAYKDEYEVARLHLDGVERARMQDAFGPGARVVLLLHPPLLRTLGLERKLRLGSWILPVLRVLRAGRRLRGTAVDPFGRAQVRRTERALVDEYHELVAQALTDLTAERAGTVRRIAELPDVVRGYEHIKMAGVREFRDHAAGLLEELRTSEPRTHEDAAALGA